MVAKLGVRCGGSAASVQAQVWNDMAAAITLEILGHGVELLRGQLDALLLADLFARAVDLAVAGKRGRLGDDALAMLLGQLAATQGRSVTVLFEEKECVEGGERTC